jgi:hypothetical protein
MYLDTKINPKTKLFFDSWLPNIDEQPAATEAAARFIRGQPHWPD